MNDISTEKISVLQNIIIDRANGQRSVLLANARKEADDWVQKEAEKLERSAKVIEQDAKTRSEDIRRRQVLAADREKSMEALRLQNRLLSQIQGLFQDGLIKLRGRSDYPEIVAGLALQAARQLKGGEPLHLRLSAQDSAFGEQVIQAAAIRAPKIKIIFDPTPAPILGGCWVLSDDQKRQVNMDWQSQTQETSDLLADRLLAVL